MQGLAWDLVWSSWRGTLKMSHLPWKRGFAGKGQSGQLSSCVIGMSALHPPLITMDNPLLWDIEGGDGTGNMIVRTKRRKVTREILSTERGFFITSRLVTKLKTYGVHVHFFLCKLIYKYWGGLPGCFLRKSVNYYCLYPGNLLTILNTMEKPILLHSVTCKSSYEKPVFKTA